MTHPEEFCRSVLPEVSRTFALNIPVLPAPLDLVVTVAYLLCRVADTLEDEATGPLSRRADLFAELAGLVELPLGWEARARHFTLAARRALRPEAPAAEIRLLEGTEQILSALAKLPTWTRPHIARCLREMTRGMSETMQTLRGARAPLGLRDLQATRDYCYYVAGTVGEMLTGLFVAFSPAAAARAAELLPRAPAFGRALQLTNILKDVREDLDRGACWLPRTTMAAHGLSPETLLLPANRGRAVAVLDELVAVALAEADVAFEYALALPAEPPGLRLFCLWPLLFAVLTLGVLRGNASVFDPAPVKIGRDAVQRVIVETQERVGSDVRLRALYAACTGRPAPATT